MNLDELATSLIGNNAGETTGVKFLSDDDLDPIIQKASKESGLDAPFIKAIIKRESGWNSNAVGHNSDGTVAPRGGKGLMQLVDSTAEEMGVTDPFDPEQNIIGGAKYMAKLIKQYGDEETAKRRYRGKTKQEDPTWFSDIDQYRKEYALKDLANSLIKTPEVSQAEPETVESIQSEAILPQPVGVPQKAIEPTYVQHPQIVEEPEASKKKGLWDALQPIKNIIVKTGEDAYGLVKTASNIVAGAAMLPIDITETAAQYFGAKYGLGERKETPEGQKYLENLDVSKMKTNPLVQEANEFFNNTPEGKWISEHDQEIMDVAFAVLIAKDMGSLAVTAAKMYKGGRPIIEVLSQFPKDVVNSVQTEIENVKKIPSNIIARAQALPQEARAFFYTDGWRSMNEKEKSNLKDWLNWERRPEDKRGEEPVIPKKIKEVFTTPEAEPIPGKPYTPSGTFDVEYAKRALRGEEVISETKLRFGLGKIFKKTPQEVMQTEQPVEPIVPKETKLIEQESPGMAKTEIIEGTSVDVQRGGQLEKLVPGVKFQGVTPGVRGAAGEIKPTFTFKIEDGNPNHATNFEVPITANAEEIARLAKRKIVEYEKEIPRVDAIVSQDTPIVEKKDFVSTKFNLEAVRNRIQAIAPGKLTDEEAMNIADHMTRHKVTGIPSEIHLQTELEKPIPEGMKRFWWTADLDRFKSFNDLGHNFGDNVMVIGQSRANDVANDVGGVVHHHIMGDEMAGPVYAKDLAEAISKMEKIKQEVNSRMIELKDGKKVPLGLTIGIGNDLASADAAATTGKQNGKRNSECSFRLE